jgi:integrase/recombinase XerD
VEDLRDAMAFHQLVLGSEGASPNTQRQYLYYEGLYLDYLKYKHLPPRLGQLTLEHAREFLMWYRERDCAQRTRGGEIAVRQAASMLKRFGTVLEEHGVLDENPLLRLRRPKVARHTRQPFSATELNALWGACFRTDQPARDEALVLLLWDTGMRIGEACSLRIDGLDLASHLIRVGAEGKSRRERLVPLGTQDGKPGRTIRALQRYLQVRPAGRGRHDEYVFLSRTRTKLTAQGGNEVIKRVASLAGVDNAYPHRYRHTYATWYLTAYPGDELGLRRIIGHISQEVLADYVHFSQTTIAERAGRASPVDSILGHARAPALVEAASRPRSLAGQARIGERSPSRGFRQAESPDWPYGNTGS